jgi:hypothetical protein
VKASPYVSDPIFESTPQAVLLKYQNALAPKYENRTDKFNVKLGVP